MIAVCNNQTTLSFSAATVTDCQLLQCSKPIKHKGVQGLQTVIASNKFDKLRVGIQIQLR